MCTAGGSVARVLRVILASGDSNALTPGQSIDKHSHVVQRRGSELPRWFLQEVWHSSKHVRQGIHAYL